jgi:hypothetical protein
MSRSIGLSPRRAAILDGDSIVVGYVGPQTRGVAAATRNGAAMLMTTDLGNTNEFKAVLYGQTANAAGGYLLEVAHVPAGGAIGDATGWTTAAVLSASGIGRTEAIISGAAIWAAVKAAASLTTSNPRVYAVRATAGTGSNGAAIPAGTLTLALQPCYS